MINPKGARGDRISAILGGSYASKAEGTSIDRLVNIFPAGLETKDDRLIGTVIHEMGHTKATEVFGGTKPGEVWAKAMDADGGKPITNYGGKNHDEDFAEAIRMYVETKGGIADFQYRQKYRNRFELIDQILGINSKGNEGRTKEKMDALIQAGLDKLNLQLGISASKGVNGVASVLCGDDLFLFEDDE